jgi:hypothetical protein
VAQATIKLPSGTVVTIDGNATEIRDLLQHYESKSPVGADRKGRTKKKSDDELTESTSKVDGSGPVEIANVIKSCDRSEAIERKILDKSSQLNRTLLPLFVIQQVMNADIALGSGEIAAILAELGVPVAQPNVAKALRESSKYVVGDRLRKKGKAVKYKLSRRGLQYMTEVIDD